MSKKTYQKDNSRRNKGQEISDIKEELLHFARSSWGQIWIKSILEYGRPYRMQRGVRYAKEDRIENLTVNPGLIFATVQGTAPTPYRVKINFDVIPEEIWNEIISSIAEKAIYIIQLLENKMPEELVSIFDKNNHSLFPQISRELNATCSCPDKAIPCKHIAATILYISRVLDFDPFLLLKLRGMSKEEILKKLRMERSCGKKAYAQATKKIREQINIAEKSFDFPSIGASDLSNQKFFIGEPYNVGIQIKQPSSNIETLNTLGIIPNLENPDSFEIIFKELYYNVTQSIYRSAISLEQKKKEKTK